MNVSEQLARIRRGCSEIISEAELTKKLERGVPLRIKAGFDLYCPRISIWGIVFC